MRRKENTTASPAASKSAAPAALAARAWATPRMEAARASAGLSRPSRVSKGRHVEAVEDVEAVEAFFRFREAEWS